MSEILDLSAHRSLELLARLRETFTNYAQREDRHARDFAAKRHAANRNHRDDTSRADNTWETRIHEAESIAANEEARVRAFHDHRKARIAELREKRRKRMKE